MTTDPRIAERLRYWARMIHSQDHPSQAGHWYLPNGDTAYEVTSPKGMRPTTLRDARKLGLYPSVTSVLGILAKPQLEAWKVRQALLSAYTLPRNPGETDDEHIERALADSKTQAKEAAAEGTRIHAVIQGAFEGRPPTPQEAVYVRAVTEALDSTFGPQNWKAEQSFASPMGFGGKSDLICTEAVVDIKCKDFDDSKDVDKLAYPEHCTQLAAYAYGNMLQAAKCANVFVSTKVPGLVKVKLWEPQEVFTGWEIFKHLFGVWCLERGYIPVRLV